MAASAQGSLTPPGTPAPTMKSLSEINEGVTSAVLAGQAAKASASTAATNAAGAQTAAQAAESAANTAATNASNAVSSASIAATNAANATTAANTAAANASAALAAALDAQDPGIPIRASDLPLTITTPGRYFLAESINFSATDTNAISIETSHVTIDMRGHSLVGPGKAAGSSGDGIRTGKFVDGIAVVNGTVSSWRGNGISLIAGGAANGFLIDRINAVENGSVGIVGGQSGTISNCASYNNAFGISAYIASNIVNCSAYSNDYSGFLTSSFGVNFKNCAAAFNDTDGFYIITGTVIEGCSATRNRNDGIQVQNGCLVLNNQCYANGIDSGTGAGIHATSGSNRIEGNLLTSNVTGLDVDSAGNFIVKNSAKANTTNYDITGTQTIGEISTATGTILDTVSPWANFEF